VDEREPQLRKRLARAKKNITHGGEYTGQSQVRVVRSAMCDDNPISQRMNVLHGQWLAFTRSQSARLLVWRVTRDEISFVDTFIARECDAATAQTPDLFVQLLTPFQAAPLHGLALTDELRQRYELADQDLDAARQHDHWSAPQLQPGRSDVELLVATLLSFREHHLPVGAEHRMVVSLEPSSVESVSSYALWLQRLVHAAPQELRFLMLDPTTREAYARLTTAEPQRVMAMTCALDLPGALEAAARTAPRTDPSPGAQLQLLQTQLGSAIAETDLSRVVGLAAAATQLALSQGWPHFAAGAQMMLAAGHSKSEQYLDALAAYSRAEQHALALQALPVAHDDVAGASGSQAALSERVRLAALLGRCVTLLALQAYDQAADSYLEAAALAHSVDEPCTELDGYRLAAVCYALASLPDKAWAMGMHGLRFAMTLSEETRKSSTLPHLAQHLSQMASEGNYRAHHGPLEEQLSRLLGRDWRTQLAQTAGD
jgi:tetratricopeptide (TPR) repeat protein